MTLIFFIASARALFCFGTERQAKAKENPPGWLARQSPCDFCNGLFSANSDEQGAVEQHFLSPPFYSFLHDQVWLSVCPSSGGPVSKTPFLAGKVAECRARLSELWTLHLWRSSTPPPQMGPWEQLQGTLLEQGLDQKISRGLCPPPPCRDTESKPWIIVTGVGGDVAGLWGQAQTLGLHSASVLEVVAVLPTCPQNKVMTGEEGDVVTAEGSSSANRLVWLERSIRESQD